MSKPASALQASPPAPSAHPPKAPLGKLIAWGLLLALLAFSWRGAEMRPLDLFTNAQNMVEYGKGFFPPDFGEWRTYVQELIVTLEISLWGTAMAVVCAVPLGLLAASNLTPRRVHLPTRRFLDACRAINEMVFALLFCVAVGLGPFAGVLALWVHTTGVLGKLFSETVEAIDPQPVEGIRATGAHSIAVVAFGVVPQVTPLWMSYTLYRLESNVRAASVVGMVGAGGIGMVLWDVIRSFQYGATAAVLIMLLVTVSVIDLLSAQLRKHLI
jgi:phosphonate transport system permease protein